MAFALAAARGLTLSSLRLNFSRPSANPVRFFVLCVLALALELTSSAAIVTWTSASSATRGASINAAVNAGGQYLVVGGSGYIATSPDGVVWTRRTSGTSQSLFGVAYGAGRYVAVGAGGLILTSTLGTTWSVVRTSPPGGFLPDLNGIVYGKDRFVAVGRSLGSTTNENILTSTDGFNWQAQNIDAAGYQLQFVSYGNGQYIAGGGGLVLASPDAITWRTTYRNNAIWFYGGASNGARWAVTGTDGTVLASDDGGTWTQASLGGQRALLYAVVARGGHFLAAGENLFSLPGNTASMFASDDGKTWTAVVFPASASLTRYDSMRALLATDAGYFGFGAGGLIAASGDGVAWTRTSGSAVVYTDVAYGNHLLVAVGSKPTNEDAPGINPGRLGVAAISLDGVNWIEQQTGIRGAQLRRVTFGNGRFVAAGPGGVIVYSDDAVTWHPATPPVLVSWTGIAYGNGQFLAVGSSIVSSPDGVTWTQRSGPSANNVKFLNGQFYLLKSGGGAARSADGATWEDITSLARAVSMSSPTQTGCTSRPPSAPACRCRATVGSGRLYRSPGSRA